MEDNSNNTNKLNDDSFEAELDAILRDFGDFDDDFNTVIDDTNTDFMDDFSGDASVRSESADTDKIEKPDGVSITGAFEAIRSEKNMSSAALSSADNAAGSAPSVAVSDEMKSESNEILDDIPRMRFFDTDTFESVKQKSSTENPIASFAKNGGTEQDVEGEEVPVIEPTEEIDDYESEDDREDVLAELKKLKTSATFKTVFTFLLACVSAALYVVFYAGINVPGIDITYDTVVYLPFILAISVAASVVNAFSLTDGIKSLFKLKAIPESFLALIFIFSSVLDVCYIVLKTPAEKCVIFDLLYLIMLFFCIAAKRLIVVNMYKNFLVASADGSKLVINNQQQDELINDIIVDTGCPNEIAYASRSEFVKGFIRRSFCDFDVCNKYTSPGIVMLVSAFAVTIINYIVVKSFTNSLMLFVGAMCAVSPIVQGINFALSLSGNSKRARKNGGVIIGSKSCAELDDVQTVVTDDTELFGVTLNGIRFYADESADDVILYLNSLYRVTGGPLKSLFENMLSDDIKSLPRIDDIYYHEDMGYSALINSKIFLAGNRNLMDHFGIHVDDSEYEIIYRQKSKHVLFAAYDNKIVGVFLLSYTMPNSVKNALKLCERDQLCLVIAKHDENVNSDTLFYHYNTQDKLLFKIMNFGNAQRCVSKLIADASAQSQITSRTGLSGLIKALHGCKSIKFAISANRVIRIMSSVIALGLVAFLSFFSGITGSFPLQILVYQLLWLIPELFISIFSK